MRHYEYHIIIEMALLDDNQVKNEKMCSIPAIENIQKWQNFTKFQKGLQQR